MLPAVVGKAEHSETFLPAGKEELYQGTAVYHSLLCTSMLCMSAYSRLRRGLYLFLDLPVSEGWAGGVSNTLVSGFSSWRDEGLTRVIW